MASFFISWQLWQQMTFCLGAAICLVFVTGYGKLCWTHQYVKKQEAVDEERRTHDLEMRKSGLPAMKKVTEIPFGVRAIQSGIQVDGIWISSHSLPTKTQSTLVSMDISIPGRSNAKGKGLDTMAPGLAGVEVRDGFAEGIPLGDGWGDGCVVAQAFHWFANEKALREIHRVLKPRSSLGLIWNIEDYNKPAAWTASTQWEQRLNELIHSLDGDGQARFRNDAWRACFDSQAANPLKTVAGYGLPGLATADDGKAPWFSVPIGEDSVPFTVWLTEEALWKRLSTLSQVAVLDGDELSRFRARLAEMLREESVERNDKGEVALHGKTFFAWTSRL
ncbi:putative methyltransferase C25B8.09 like protein [Verticillium longisporum]|nr:putative methyltransferase C25B8.09 like protein [Verticillium longisporum]